mmetsp:Transcript_13510/g.25915  ORF Transcript_13510/g.25915 Transcript_13510/m.25915 type:complete len:92 (-) Transcript_13510:79-354(-)
MTVAAWPDAMACAARSDTPDALFSMLQNKPSLTVGHGRDTKTGKTPNSEFGKIYAWEKPRRCCEWYIAHIVFVSAALKATGPVMLLFLLTL